MCVKENTRGVILRVLHTCRGGWIEGGGGTHRVTVCWKRRLSSRSILAAAGGAGGGVASRLAHTVSPDHVMRAPPKARGRGGGELPDTSGRGIPFPSPCPSERLREVMEAIVEGGV